MTIMTEKLVDDYFCFKFDSVDLIYAYADAKGIDDPEEVSDEEYEALERECESLITPKFCSLLNDRIIEKITDIVYDEMRSIVRK